MKVQGPVAGGSGGSSIIIVLDTELKGARSRSRKQAFPNWLGRGGSLVKKLLQVELLGEEDKPLQTTHLLLQTEARQ